MSRVLITGINGFIGRNLCTKLREVGHSLIGTTRDASLRAGPDNVPLCHVTNIGPNTDWSFALSGADAVVHLAAKAHTMKKDNSRHKSEYQIVNYEGTRRLAEEAVNAGVRRFVFLSTAKVNGEATHIEPFVETDIPAPSDDYAKSKWEAEQCLLQIGKEKGLEIVILRVPLVYGPHVKANFLKLLQACGNRRFLPLGSIVNRRSLLYVGNLVSVVSICLDHPSAPGKTFMLSDGEDVSTPELIRNISVSLGCKHRLFSLPKSLLVILGIVTGKRNSIDRLTESFEVDSSLIQKELQWLPPFSTMDGLGETARWFNETYGGDLTYEQRFE